MERLIWIKINNDRTCIFAPCPLALADPQFRGVPEMATEKLTMESLPGLAETQALWRSAFEQGPPWMNGPEAFGRLQAAAETWMAHRQDDLVLAIEAYRQICESKDFAKAASIQQAWAARYLQGLVADWMALIDPMTAGARSSKGEMPPASRKAA